MIYNTKNTLIFKNLKKGIEMKKKFKISRKFINKLLENVDKFDWERYEGIEQPYLPFFAPVDDKTVFLETRGRVGGDAYAIVVKPKQGAIVQSKPTQSAKMKKFFKTVEKIVKNKESNRTEKGIKEIRIKILRSIVEDETSSVFAKNYALGRLWGLNVIGAKEAKRMQK